MLAAIAFLQMSLAFSDCQLDRASLADTLRSSMSEPCHEEAVVAKHWVKFENRCFAHCTADLQTVGHGVALIRNPADAPVLALPPAQLRMPVRVAFEGPRPGTPPPRILFGSLLI